MELISGDKVQTRSWDDLVDEFGLDSDGDINTNNYIPAKYRNILGRIETIHKVYGDTVTFKNPHWGDRNVPIEALLPPSAVHKIGDIHIVPQLEHTINSLLSKGYTIREFTKDKCILTYVGIATLKDTNE